jgi:C-terminal processing protease CtpA/Prc
MTFTDAIPLLRGPEGTTVTLVVVKVGDAQRNAVTITVPRRLVRG